MYAEHKEIRSTQLLGVDCYVIISECISPVFKA